MIRLKAVGDTVVVSTKTDNLPGRGCYSCPRETCIEKALNRGRLSRALRKNIAVFPSREDLHRAHEQKGYPDDHVDR